MNSGEIWLLSSSLSFLHAYKLFQGTGEVPGRARLSYSFFGERARDPGLISWPLRLLASSPPSPAVFRRILLPAALYS